jgi:hypothetical protein
MSFNTIFMMVISPLYIASAWIAQIRYLPLLRVLSFAWGMCPQSCSLATALVLSTVYTAVTWQWVNMSQYNSSSSVRLSRTVSPKRRVIEKLLEKKYVSFGETTEGKLTFLLYARVRVQANFFFITSSVKRA